MKKRGLSEVVTTLILVLLVLVAIAIVWVVISNLIRDKGDDIGASTFEVSMAVKTVEPSSTSGNVLVRVERNVGEGNLQGINIIMSDGINSETVRVDPIDEGEETTYDISKGGLGAITKVSIRPIGGSEGNEKVGEVVGERELSYEQSVKSLGGLIAWWEFENDAKDSSGSVPLHDGTNNGATFVDGKVGKAADFDGVNDYIAIGGTPINLATDWSASFWVYIKIESAGQGILTKPVSPITSLIMNRDSSVTPPRYYPCFIVSPNGCARPNGETLSYQGRWIHIVMSHDTNGFHSYNNGESMPANPHSVGYAGGSNLNPTQIGRYSTATINGQLDELAIFNRALTADEVKSIYELTK